MQTNQNDYNICLGILIYDKQQLLVETISQKIANHFQNTYLLARGHSQTTLTRFCLYTYSLCMVDISSTTYLPRLFNTVYERPRLVENATEQKRGKRLRLRPFKKLLELLQNTLLTKESALPVSCLWDRGDLKVLNHTI